MLSCGFVTEEIVNVQGNAFLKSGPCIRAMCIPYNCHFFYTDTIFVRIKFTPKNADFSR